MESLSVDGNEDKLTINGENSFSGLGSTTRFDNEINMDKEKSIFHHGIRFDDVNHLSKQQPIMYQDMAIKVNDDGKVLNEYYESYYNNKAKILREQLDDERKWRSECEEASLRAEEHKMQLLKRLSTKEEKLKTCEALISEKESKALQSEMLCIERTLDLKLAMKDFEDLQTYCANIEMEMSAKNAYIAELEDCLKDARNDIEIHVINGQDILASTGEALAKERILRGAADEKCSYLASELLIARGTIDSVETALKKQDNKVSEMGNHGE